MQMNNDAGEVTHHTYKLFDSYRPLLRCYATTSYNVCTHCAFRLNIIRLHSVCVQFHVLQYQCAEQVQASPGPKQQPHP
jgi:hypothetical protein